jgi:TonB family protein
MVLPVDEERYGNGGIRMTTLTSDSGYASGRMMVLFCILGAHAILIYLLSTSMLGNGAIRLPTSFEAFFIPEDPQVRPTPPPLPTVRERVPVELLAPLEPIEYVADPDARAISVTPNVTPPAGVASAVAPQPKMMPLQYVARRSADELYPAISQRMGEQGVAEVEACVAANGRLDGAPSVRTSSGYARLDAAALQWAQELRYRAATADGVPVRACKGFRVTFQLKGD